MRREISGRPESLLGPPRPCEETSWFAFAPVRNFDCYAVAPVWVPIVRRC